MLARATAQPWNFFNIFNFLQCIIDSQFLEQNYDILLFNHSWKYTFDCHTRQYGFLWFNSCITEWTVAPTSDGYESPLFTAYFNNKQSIDWFLKKINRKFAACMTFKGSECAENSIMTLSLLSSGKCFNSSSILWTKVFTRSGCVDHLSMILHFICFGNCLQER